MRGDDLNKIADAKHVTKDHLMKKSEFIINGKHLQMRSRKTKMNRINCRATKVKRLIATAARTTVSNSQQESQELSVLLLTVFNKGCPTLGQKTR